jgi:hypothetical protein
MKKHPKKLQFISRIAYDGLSVMPVTESQIANMETLPHTYELRPLSITEQTYLAFNVATYVVKLK